MDDEERKAKEAHRERIVALHNKNEKLHKYKRKLLTEGIVVDGSFVPNGISFGLWNAYKRTEKVLQERLKRLRGY